MVRAGIEVKGKVGVSRRTRADPLSVELGDLLEEFSC